MIVLNQAPLMALEWEKFHSEDGIDLFRAQAEDSGLIPFKAEAIVEGDWEEYLKHLLDSKGRSTWAPKLEKILIHEHRSPNKIIYSEYYKTPWPAMDRQFLLEGEVDFLDENHVRLVGKNSNRDEFISSEHIKCDVKFLIFELTNLGENKTKLSFSFLGDMQGWMPVWLINIIQKRWPVRFIQEIRKQAKYNEAIDIRIFRDLER